MTPPVDDSETLRRILANTEALLLDFDGPICSVFAGIPASVVADQLRDVLIHGGHRIPDDVQASTDPFDVLFYAAKLGPDEARLLEATFRAHEVEAVQSAEPTPCVHDLIKTWKATGRLLAIVSNNSIAAIESYLNIHNIRHLVDVVSARAGADISRLKPDPCLVLAALRELNIPKGSCSFVGDSSTDVQAAKAAMVRAIAYANKAGKIDKLLSVNPSVVITSISVLLAAIDDGVCANSE
ncbi:HAD family hydrolase [Actinophytocola sp.]|uniref:HAD family hydrolase n=1 Tax=Actinophytocola sp. TaxID=1872138 RepID=UPI00389B1C7D